MNEEKNEFRDQLWRDAEPRLAEIRKKVEEKFPPVDIKQIRSEAFAKRRKQIVVSFSVGSLAVATAVLAFGFLPILFDNSIPLDSKAKQMSTTVLLPSHFELRPHRLKLILSEGTTRLAGVLTEKTSTSDPKVRFFNAQLEGKDSQGNVGVFSGKVWLTNSVVVETNQDFKNIVGAFFDGTFTIAGQGGEPVKQPYLP